MLWGSWKFFKGFRPDHKLVLRCVLAGSKILRSTNKKRYVLFIFFIDGGVVFLKIIYTFDFIWLHQRKYWYFLFWAVDERGNIGGCHFYFPDKLDQGLSDLHRGHCAQQRPSRFGQSNGIGAQLGSIIACDPIWTRPVDVAIQ